MRNIFKQGFWVLLSAIMFAACSPQEDDKYSLGELGTVTPDIVSFSQAPSPTSNNGLFLQILGRYPPLLL